MGVERGSHQNKDTHLGMARARSGPFNHECVRTKPGHVPGDYGLIIGGIGDTYTVSFPKAVTETTRTFAMRDTSAGWSFEVFDGPCSARAKQ